MFQWTWNDIEHNRILPFDRSKLEAIILTHAHLDHIWRVPMLEKDEILIKKPSWEIVKSSKSFNWFIYTSHAWKWLTEVMLVDSARVMAKEQVAKMKMIEGKKANLTDMIKQLENLKKCQNISFWRKWRTNTSIQELNFQEHINEQILKIEEERAKYRWINIGNIDKVFKTFSKDIEDKILYTTKEVDAVKSKIKWTGFYKEKSISSLKWQKTNPWISFVLHWAEHVFWSAIVSVFIDDWKWWTINLWFSWDLWRFFEPYNLIEPDIPRFEYDTFMIESTYWWREHKPWRLEEKIKITNAMNNVFNRWWKIVIPAFMLQRHQDISSFLIEMQEEWLIPKNIKIYYDWWSIKSINNIYRVHDKDKVYEKLFNSKNFIFAWNNKDPEANEFLKSDVPSVIIAPSGMLNGWTIMQYLSILKSPKNACMLFWYQWAWTTGRKLLEASENWVKSIYVPEVTDNENDSWAYLHIVKNVNLFQWKSFTTHWDQNDLLYFLSELKFKPNGTILINHWDFEEWQLALAEALKKQSFLRKDINVVLTQVGGKLSNTSPFTNWWQYKVNAIIEKKEKPKKTEDIIPIKEILITSKKYQPLKWVFDRDMFRKMWGKISPSGSFVLNDKQVDDILFAIYEKKIDKMDMVLWFIAWLIVKSTDEEIQNFLQNPFIKKEEKIEQNQKDNTELEEPQIIEEQELIKDIFTKKRKFKEWKNSKNDLEKQEFLILVKRIWKKLYSAEISFRSWTNSKKKIKEITWMDIDSLKEELVNLGYILPYMTLAEKWYTIVNADKVSAKTFINETKKDNTIEIEIKSSWSFIAGAIYYKGELIKTIKWSTKKALSNELRKLLWISDNIDLKNRTKWKKIEVILNESWLSIVKKILVKNSLQKPENIIEVKIIKWKNRVEGLIYYKWNIIKQVFGNSKTDVSRLIRESWLIPTKTQLIDKDWKIKKITLNESTFAILEKLLKNPPILKKEISKENLLTNDSLKEWKKKY
jgi:predicted metal-dependent RNase